MYKRILLTLASVTSLALTTLLAGTGSAATALVPVQQGATAEARVLEGPVCKGGANLGAPNGDGITAQTFESTYAAYTSYGGADFKLKKKCKVNSVYVEGTTGGPANGINLQVVRDGGGLPDKDRVRCEAFVEASGPIFKVPFRCTLAPGKYWLIVSVDQTADASGQWFWSTTNARVGSSDAWKNPGDGFLTGCTEWSLLGPCLGFADYEYIFAMQKGRV